MKSNFSILIFISIWLVVFSCKKDKPAPAIDLESAYFPNEVGRYVIYKVDSISYNDFFNPVKIDTAHYQIKEIIESHFEDNEGRESERIERYYRKNDLQTWILKDVWYQTRTRAKAEKVEEDVRYVKLIFPPQLNTPWNGNAFNTMDKQDYEYKNIDVRKKIGSLSFDSTITVLQIADSNLIQKKYAVEVYAKNIGMIYKRFVDVVDKSNVIQPLPFSERIDAGVDYTYSVIEFGKL